MTRFLLAIDQGTTGSTALVLSERAEVMGRATQEFPQHFPQPGWVEHDLEEIWASVLAVGRRARSKAAGGRREDCAAIGITNQRETTVLWDRKTGQADRTARSCGRTAAPPTAAPSSRPTGTSRCSASSTGLVLDPYFSRHEDRLAARQRRRARARAPSAASSLRHDRLLPRASRLTGGARARHRRHNASRTLLFESRALALGRRAARALCACRARCCPRSRHRPRSFGHTRGLSVLARRHPDRGHGRRSAGGAVRPGLLRRRRREVHLRHRRVHPDEHRARSRCARSRAAHHGRVAARRRDHATRSRAAAFIAGAAVQWLRDRPRHHQDAAEVEALARTVPRRGGVMFVPAFAGLGAPHWRPGRARADHRASRAARPAAHLARATLEGIALQIVDIPRAMDAMPAAPLGALRVDGGAAANDLLMQFQADVLGVEIARPSLSSRPRSARRSSPGSRSACSTTRLGGQVHRIDRHFTADDEPEQSRRTLGELARRRAARQEPRLTS